MRARARAEPGRAGAPEAAGHAADRLSAQDASFLDFERPAHPMHVGLVAILDAGPLATPAGGVDAPRITAHLAGCLPRLPRYRQRLAFPPLPGRPAWVDDEGFDLRRHVRHVALPRPGGDAELATFAGRLLAEPLDRRRPLWETCVVEGLAGGRFALAMKLHHCMVDGVSGIGLLPLLFSPSPDAREGAAPPWQPRRAPGGLRLLLEEAAARARLPLDGLAALGRAAADPGAAWRRGRAAAGAVAEALAAGLRRTPPPPLRGPTGPWRSVAWRVLDLAEVKALRRRLDGTVNDVVLAVVAGALRHLPAAAGAPRDWRVAVPVNARPPDDPLRAANRVSALLVTLPVAEPDPLRRFARVREETARGKASHMAEGIDLLARLADRSGSPWLTRLGVELVERLQPYHLIVSNVPGPQAPLYLLGARLRVLVPQLPLFGCQGLGVAAISYDGGVHVGLVADPAKLPDVDALASGVDAAFAELRAASGATGAASGATGAAGSRMRRATASASSVAAAQKRIAPA